MSAEGPAAGRATWEERFDELADLEPGARATRLAAIRTTDPELATRLAAMLAADERTARVFGPAAPAEAGADAAPDESAGRLPPGARLGAWKLDRFLGRGGMGEVYLAERADGGFAQRAAVKIVSPGRSSKAVLERFVRERQILADLRHPNIARLLDGGSAPDGRPFFVLEWVDGESITAYCRARSLGLDARLALLTKVCEAVDSAHRQLIVHRDLKPGNILVTATGEVKLLDFGIAKLLAAEPGERLTVTVEEGRALTPAYAAPEQILGEPVTMATDVYALGVLLYELLTGALPHQRGSASLTELAREVTTESPERPSVLLERGESVAVPLVREARRVAGDLDLIVLTALHREPARRYRSAMALAEDLGRFRARRPIRARPDSLGYRFGRLVRRNPWAFAAAALALVALVGGFAVALREARTARLEAARADLEQQRAERVKEFLVSIFRQSDPDLAMGSDPRASELLRAGASRVERELAGEPAVLADLLETIARVETNLGLLDDALASAERALALRRKLVPADPARIARGTLVLAEAKLARGAPDDARALIEPVLPALRAAAGAESVEAAKAERLLAATLHRPADQPTGIALLEHALAIEVRALGEEHEETAATRLSLGGALETAQRYGDAEREYRAAAASLERLFGPDHPRVAEGLSELASLLDRLSRADEARPLLERAIRIERQTLGARHERLAQTLFSYGILELGAQHYAAAEAALHEALDIFGADRFETGHCLRYLGLAAAGGERYREAASLFERAAETYGRTLGADNLQRHRALANVGWAHLRMGRTSEALAELAAAVAAIERVAGAESYEIRLPLKQLGEAETTAGQADRSIATLERVRALEEKLFATREHREIGGSDLLLARALLARGGAGDREAAKAALDEGLGIFARKAPEDLLYGESLLERARLSLADGDRARARGELALARPILVAKRGPGHAATREATRLLAKLPAPPKAG